MKNVDMASLVLGGRGGSRRGFCHAPECGVLCGAAEFRDGIAR